MAQRHTHTHTQLPRCSARGPSAGLLTVPGGDTERAVNHSKAIYRPRPPGDRLHQLRTTRFIYFFLIDNQIFKVKSEYCQIITHTHTHTGPRTRARAQV